jgi:hypothetical protein
MRRVVVESPLAGKTVEDVSANFGYAKRAIADCFRRGEAPFASHLLYPGTLNDEDPDDRRLGMMAGFEWILAAEASVVYTDRGVSSGMRAGIARAKKIHLPIEYRTIPKTLPSPDELATLIGLAGYLIDPDVLGGLASSDADVLKIHAWATTIAAYRLVDPSFLPSDHFLPPPAFLATHLHEKL